jgi:hypothetical protein
LKLNKEANRRRERGWLLCQQQTTEKLTDRVFSDLENTKNFSTRKLSFAVVASLL